MKTHRRRSQVGRSRSIRKSWPAALAGIGAVAALALGSPAYAGEAAPAVQEEIQRLQERIGRAPDVQDVQEELQRLQDLVVRGSEERERQARLLEEQERALEAQRRRLEELEAQVYRAMEPRVQPAFYQGLPRMRKPLGRSPWHAQAKPEEKPPASANPDPRRSAGPRWR